MMRIFLPARLWRLPVKHRRIVIIIVFIIIAGVLLSLTVFASPTPVSPTSVLNDFVGDYYDGELVRHWLFLNPDQTFIFTTYTDAGDYYEDRGTFSISLDEIHFSSANRLPHNSRDFVLVKWGGRRFLVTKEFVSDFCSSFNDDVGEHWRSFVGFGSYNYYSSSFLRESGRYEIAFGYPISPQGARICP
jgi:hypothetical protein